MNNKKTGNVCAAKNCNNKSYNCNKSFFTFPKQIDRAKTWAINSKREDLLENIDALYKSYRLCSDHFSLEMFTNKCCNRLNHKAIPTIFPALDESSRDIRWDHNYSLPRLVFLEDDEIASKKVCIIQDVILKTECESPTRSNNENLTIQELEPLNTPDEKYMNIGEEVDIIMSPQISSLSTSTQTSTELSVNSPRNGKYRETIRMLNKENKDLKEAVEKLGNKLQMLQNDILRNITLEQYQALTFKFCSSVEVANFINSQVAQCQKLSRGRRYSKEFTNECLAAYFASPKLYKQYLMKKVYQDPKDLT